MLRYDPTKNDHVQYEKVMKRKIPNNDADSEPAKLRKLNNETDFEVSKEQYYKVTNQLTSSLQPSSEGFSLLSMFGRGTDHVDVEQRNPYKEILLTKGQQKLVASNNTFHDESSDEEIIQERWTKAKDLSVNDSKQTKKTAKSEIWHEPFFIFGNDQRLQGKSVLSATFFLSKYFIISISFQMVFHSLCRIRQIREHQRNLKINKEKCEILSKRKLRNP